MKEKPYVGQRVVFNDYGLMQAFSEAPALQHMKTKVLTITWVCDESMTDDCGTWPVEVDDPAITIYCLDNHCFDLAEGKKDEEPEILFPIFRTMSW